MCCQYIKDDGEQCGRTAEPFCHDHEDTPQARIWSRMDDIYDEMDTLSQQVVSGTSGDSFVGEMDESCSHCDSPLRRTERLTEHPNFDGRVLFEAVVECDCDEQVLGAQSVLVEEICDGWV